MLKIIIVLLFSTLQVCNSYKELCASLDSQTGKISENCLKQLRIACSRTELIWTMYDASSKYPRTGISYSSYIDFGNFDECMTVNYEDNDLKILGKFCFSNIMVIDPVIMPDTSISQILQEKPNIINYNQTLMKKSNMTILENLKADNSKPMSMLSVCVPDQCTVQELGPSFIIDNLDGLIVSYIDMACTTIETNQDYEAGDIAFIVVLAIILLLIVISTIYDIYLYYSDNETKHPILLSFSYLTNGRHLLHISKSNSGQISCLNGLRFISMIWVIAFHTQSNFQGPLILNTPAITDWHSKLYSLYATAGYKAVDTFFFLTALLLIYGYLKSNLEVDLTIQLRRVPIMILHRYLRLTPALAAVYFTLITIFNKLGTGPMYTPNIEYLVEPCKKYWYSFFLYIQNYYNYDDLCLVHTWYLSADMQMFVLAPLILIPTTIFYQKHFKGVLISLGILTIICTAFPIIITLTDSGNGNDYSTDVRFVDYVIGMIAGLILLKTKDKPYFFTKLQNLIIWIVVLIIWLFIFLYNHDVETNPDKTKSAFYNGLYRPIWCICLTWLVYSCHSGNGGFINWILSRRIFQIGGKLSYCMYLVHYVVLMHYIAIMRNLSYFSDYSMFYNLCGHFFVTLFFAFICTLSFELPMLQITNFLLPSRRGPVKKQQQA